MSIINKILETYPEALTDISEGLIVVRDDSDGKGEYLACWNVEYPLPDRFKIGKIA